MKVSLKIWRQPNQQSSGHFAEYDLDGLSPDMSFLEALDILNERLVTTAQQPVAFAHDCREGICGSCGMMINGIAHGPLRATATCQLHMRHFQDGASILVEPWRADPFPVITDLIVDRGALDRIIAAGGYITAPTGGAPDGNAIPIPKRDADAAMDASACIGCGACVAACPNGSASLFAAAKITHLGLLPQGQPERAQRVLAMVAAMDEEGFGNCTWHAECQAACPKEISIDTIAGMNADWLRASLSIGLKKLGTK